MSGLRSAGFITQRGFSLFEVLITVIVISIGLLGLAGLQFAGLQAANNAQEHTLATLLAQDIEERIRANPTASLGIPFTIATTTSAPDCTSTPCDPGNMLNFDKRRWYFMINGGGDAGLDNTPMLSNASIQVDQCVPAGTIKITLEWNGSNVSSQGCNSDTDDPSVPNTLTLTFKKP